MDGAILPTTLPTALLGVTSSVTGRRWQARPLDERLALTLSQRHDLPELVGRVLAARGVALEQADAFLTPTLRALLPDPSRLADMDAAAERLAQGVMRGERIAVFADYDVDGATSAALMIRFLRAVGSDARLYVPDRLDEGYGPNPEAFRVLKAEGCQLVVTVDCGISAFTALEAAVACGLEVVVLDHHAAEPRLPPAAAVVNPNRLDDHSALGSLCAAGVTFLALIATNRALRRQGWYQQRPEPDLLGWLDLVALGTVCDVVPLTGLNRGLVSQGLKVMARRANPGLAALADSAGIKERPGAYHAGFVLGPRINAGGRVGQADLGARLLSTDDPLEAAQLARQLEGYNAERKAIEAQVLTEALARAEVEARPQLVLVAGAGWHPGVVGIVAARLAERYRRPALVMGLADGLGKASGRSVPGVDLGAAVIAARQSGLLVSGGGHAMAAGLTVESARLPELQAFLDDYLSARSPAEPAAALLMLDGVVSVAGATQALVETLARLEPFGSGNAEPRFAVANARVVRADVVGTSHVRCILSDGAGTGRLKAIAFRSLESELGQTLLTAAGRTLHLAGRLRLDRWNDRVEVQLQIEDAAG